MPPAAPPPKTAPATACPPQQPSKPCGGSPASRRFPACKPQCTHRSWAATPCPVPPATAAKPTPYPCHWCANGSAKSAGLPARSLCFCGSAQPFFVCTPACGGAMPCASSGLPSASPARTCTARATKPKQARTASLSPCTSAASQATFPAPAGCSPGWPASQRRSNCTRKRSLTSSSLWPTSPSPRCPALCPAAITTASKRCAGPPACPGTSGGTLTTSKRFFRKSPASSPCTASRAASSPRPPSCACHAKTACNRASTETQPASTAATTP